MVEATEHQTEIVPYVVLITNVSKSENSKTDGGALIPLWLRYFQHLVQMKVKKNSENIMFVKYLMLFLLFLNNCKNNLKRKVLHFSRQFAYS